MGRRASSSATTAPKGRATASRGGSGGGRQLLTPTVQWILVVIVGLAIIVGILWALRDIRSTGGGGHTGDAPIVDITAMPSAA